MTDEKSAVLGPQSQTESGDSHAQTNRQVGAENQAAGMLPSSGPAGGQGGHPTGQDCIRSGEKRMYAIKRPNGRILTHTVSDSRYAAIQCLCTSHPWSEYLSYGWACVAVAVRQVHDHGYQYPVCTEV